MTLSIHLGILEGAGLIQLASVQPELEYLFRHMLVKDAAYHSLVKGDRRALHRVVGEALEQLRAGAHASAPRPDEIYPLLAFHFAQAGDAPRAQRYFSLAGDAAAASYANLEAAAHFTQAIAAALQNGANATDLIHLHTRLGRMQELSGDYSAALATYARLESLGQARGDQAMVLAALVPQAVIRAVPSASVDMQLAARLTTRALELAHQLGDRATEARARWARMLYEMLIGHSVEAIHAGRIALDMARGLGLTELTALILSDLGRAFAGAGQLDASLNMLSEARELWRQLGNQPMLADNLSNIGGSFYFRGDNSAALATLEEAYQVSRAIGNAWGQSYSLMLRGFVLADSGSLQAAIEALNLCIELAAAGGFSAPLIEGRCGLGLIFANLGQLDRAEAQTRAVRQLVGLEPSPVLAALDSIEALIKARAGDLEAAEALAAEARAATEPGDLTTFAMIYLPLTEGELSLARGDYASAAAAPAAVLAFEREIGVHAFRVDLLLLQVRGLIGLGRLDEAAAGLREARAETDAGRGQGWQWAVLAAQAQIAQLNGDQAQAIQLRRAARAAVDSLAAGLKDPEVRAGLLNRPDVQALAAAETCTP